MARDNSEDAVSWNVFRFLERNNIIESFLDSITGTFHKSSEVIYQSHSQKEDAGWSLLDEARGEFGERIERASETDIIVKTDEAQFFIEAKIKADNKTVPSDVSNSKNMKLVVIIGSQKSLSRITQQLQQLRENMNYYVSGYLELGQLSNLMQISISLIWYEKKKSQISKQFLKDILKKISEGNFYELHGKLFTIIFQKEVY